MGICVTSEAIKKAYLENEDFKKYVDAYATSRDKSIESALEDEIVRIVYKQYVTK